MESTRSFSGPHKQLSERGLVNREDNQYQYRFRDITDLDTSKHLFTIEHEVRSLSHPMCLRRLVNRNPIQTARNYSMATTRLRGRWSRCTSTISASGCMQQMQAAAKAN